MPTIDWLDGKADSKGRELLETCTEEGLQQLVSFPTHTKGNVLDLVITNCQEKVLEVCDVGRLGRSDHCILSITVDAEPSRTSEVKAGHIWSKADIPAIIQDMDNQDWRREIEVRSVEEAWELLTLTLTESIDSNVPKGKPKTKFKHP